MTRRLLLLAALAGAGIWLIGCGGSSNGGGGNGDGDGDMDPSTPLIGFWQPIDARQGDRTVSIKTAMNWDSNWTNATYTMQQSGDCILRPCQGATQLAAINETWWTDNGVGEMTSGGMTMIIQSSFAFGNIAQMTLRHGGNTYEVRMARIANLSEHDTQAIGTWRVQSVRVDGADVPVATFFSMAPGSEAITVQLLAGADAIARELAGELVVDRDTGSWASGGGTALGDVPEPFEWVDRAIYSYEAPGIVVTFLNRMTGKSVRIALSRWAPTDPRDTQIIGTWRAVSATSNGSPVPLRDVFEGSAQSTTYLVQLWSDGTMEERVMAGVALERAELNWFSAQAGELRMDSLDPDPMEILDYSVSGNVLTVSFEDLGDHIEIVFQRQ